VNFSKSELCVHFDQPIKAAAALLGVSLTQLKRICRVNGIPRWPYRKIQSLKGRINEKKILLERTLEESKIITLQEEIKTLENMIVAIKEDPASTVGWGSGSTESDEDEDSNSIIQTTNKRKIETEDYPKPKRYKFKFSEEDSGTVFIQTSYVPNKLNNVQKESSPLHQRTPPPYDTINKFDKPIDYRESLIELQRQLRQNQIQQEYLQQKIREHERQLEIQQHKARESSTISYFNTYNHTHLQSSLPDHHCRQEEKNLEPVRLMPIRPLLGEDSLPSSSSKQNPGTGYPLYKEPHRMR
jgi:hypothetical protein